MQTAECLNHLAPYLFAQIDAKKAALTEQGIDVISLGIGDPDMPTPAHIVDAMLRPSAILRTTSIPITPVRSLIVRPAPIT